VEQAELQKPVTMKVMTDATTDPASTTATTTTTDAAPMAESTATTDAAPMAESTATTDAAPMAESTATTDAASMGSTETTAPDSSSSDASSPAAASAVQSMAAPHDTACPELSVFYSLAQAMDRTETSWRILTEALASYVAGRINPQAGTVVARVMQKCYHFADDAFFAPLVQAARHAHAAGHRDTLSAVLDAMSSVLSSLCFSACRAGDIALEAAALMAELCAADTPAEAVRAERLLRTLVMRHRPALHAAGVVRAIVAVIVRSDRLGETNNRLVSSFLAQLAAASVEENSAGEIRLRTLLRAEGGLEAALKYTHRAKGRDTYFDSADDPTSAVIIATHLSAALSDSDFMQLMRDNPQIVQQLGASAYAPVLAAKDRMERIHKQAEAQAKEAKEADTFQMDAMHAALKGKSEELEATQAALKQLQDKIDAVTRLVRAGVAKP